MKENGSTQFVLITTKYLAPPEYEISPIRYRFCHPLFSGVIQNIKNCLDKYLLVDIFSSGGETLHKNTFD